MTLSAHAETRWMPAASETAISCLCPQRDQLYYRDFEIGELVREATFEQAVYWLLCGQWSLSPQPDLRALMPAERLPDTFEPLLHAAGRQSFSIAEWLLRTSQCPHPHRAQARDAINALLVAHLEHGAGRSASVVVDAVRAQRPLSEALEAGRARLQHTLEQEDFAQLDTALATCNNTVAAERWVRHLRQNGQRLSGFGHRRYRGRDPRAEALRGVLMGLSGPRAARWAQRAQSLESAMWDHCRAFPNAAFFGVALMCALGIASQHYPQWFHQARQFGLLAHALHAKAEGPAQSKPREPELLML